MEQDWSVLPLEEPEGYQLRVGSDDRAGYSQNSPQSGLPQLASSGSGSGMGGSMAHPVASRPVSNGGHRRLTPDELMAMADKMEADMKAKNSASLAMGPSVKQKDDYNPSWLDEYMASQ